MATGMAAAATAVLGSLVLVSTSIVGCSGAASQEALDKNPTPASSSGTSGSTTTSGGMTSGGTSGRTTSGGVADASVDGAIADCPKTEKEPNDNADTANTLAPILCGVIQPNSESDFLTFFLSEKSTTMQLKFDGQVTLKVDVNGQTVTLGEGSSPKVPFVKNHRYTIEIKATARGPMIPWRVELIEQ